MPDTSSGRHQSLLRRDGVARYWYIHSMLADAGGYQPGDRAEVDGKVARLAALARQEELDGILLAAQHNFAWLSAGRHNRVDSSREAGVARLLVTADGSRFVIASNIEGSRMASEVLDGLGFELIEFPWEEERRHPDLPYLLAGRAAGADALGADTGTVHARMVEPLLAGMRSRLEQPEIGRYRTLGADASRVVGEVARQVRRGCREDEIASDLSEAMVAAGMRPIVVLVGADDRIARYRHPVPTHRGWEQTLLLVACAERHGLVVALSRIVSARPDAELQTRTHACVEVFARIASATRIGATGAAIFESARQAYQAAGYPGEERLHHQGGGIGYRSREWVAHPASADVVGASQAFAWNPSISATKVEETFLLHEDGHIEFLTHDPLWPSIDVEVRASRVRLPGVLTRDA